MCRVGAIAQLGERSVRNAEVGGSTPLRSNGVKSINQGTSGVLIFGKFGYMVVPNYHL